ncbi:MAG: deoxyribodipyrimidine photo-lyase [Cyanobacteriota bacterium]
MIDKIRINNKRTRKLNKIHYFSGAIIYWMSRDQRVNDNWALLYAQKLAIEYKQPLIVIFCLVPEFLDATFRQYHFMIEGLKEVEKTLEKKNIHFKLLTGPPEKELPAFIEKNNAGCLITDFDPLKIKQQWKNAIIKNLKIPVYEVDAHNIVPCWQTSPKQEYAAYTIRPKIKKNLVEFLDNFAELLNHPFILESEKLHIDWQSIYDSLKINRNVKEISWLSAGEIAAKKTLDSFISSKLQFYATKRNDPNNDALSNMSPYLHFGHISAQRIAIEVNNVNDMAESKESYLEELIIRKELSDNYCYYNKDYDNLNTIANWSKTTLNEHRKDIRVYLYSLEQLENARTHDRLWNAAQIEMIKLGKMHGYMRMYWAKKILEWTESPEQAIEYAIYLNDKYELDGRDPNGYTGIMWSIAGIHDRAWKDRPIFGKIRYMSYNGCKSKFDINNYIKKANESNL